MHKDDHIWAIEQEGGPVKIWYICFQITVHQSSGYIYVLMLTLAATLVGSFLSFQLEPTDEWVNVTVVPKSK